MPAKRPSAKKLSPQSQPTQPSEGYIAVAFVRAPHGLKGEVAIDPMTDFPDRFMPGSVLWAGGQTYTVTEVRAHTRTLLLSLEGIDTRSQAEVLRGKLLEVPEATLSRLGDDEYFRFDIVGIAVVDKDGTSLGNVEEVLETGANDVYIIRDAESEILIPAIDSVVKKIDTTARRMTVELIPGLEPRPLKRPRGG